MFDHLIGNEAIKAYLLRCIQKNTLPHALLFSGFAGVGKSLFAKALSSFLLKTTQEQLESHPDFHPLFPESKSGVHSIDSLRLLIDESHKASFKGEGKVFIIYEAHKMQTASANALLKTLEEPNPDTTLILLTEHANEVIPTICSRCSHLDFKPIEESLIAKFLQEKGRDASLAKIAHGSIGKALTPKTQIETAVFSLLNQRRIYPDLLTKLSEIDKLAENEDPVEKNHKIEGVFETILMWFRDQCARQVDTCPEYLFFPNEKKVDRAMPSIEKVLAYVEEARLGVTRNLKLSVCLEACLNKLGLSLE